MVVPADFSGRPACHPLFLQQVTMAFVGGRAELDLLSLRNYRGGHSGETRET